MNWKDKRVLVTGAGGFIGTYLTTRLVDLGSKVRGFIRYNSRNDLGLFELLSPQYKEEIDVFSGDLRDTKAVFKAMEGIEVVFHLGAMISIPYSYEHPQEVIETNIRGTLSILKASKDIGVERVLNTSTSEVYGTAQYIPIDEKHPLQAQSPYSASKIGADALAESFQKSYDLPVSTVRPFNAFGPRQSARAVIPTIITQALTQDQIRLGSMHPTRNFTFVSDTVDGFIKIAESEKTIGEVINIGSDVEISIADLADKIVSIVGRDVKVVFDAVRVRPSQSEVKRLVADSSKAKELADWEPQVSFEEGLAKTVDWISQHLNLYKPSEYNI